MTEETETKKLEKNQWTKVKESDAEDIPTKRRYIIPILIILIIVGTVGYMVYDKWQSNNSEHELEIFELGAQYGYETVLLEIFNEAIICEPILLNNEDVTITLISADCLSD